MGRVVALTERDKDAVLGIVREVHGKEMARLYAVHWDWRIDGNPSFEPREVYRLGYEEDGEIKGTITVMPAKVKIGDQILPCLSPIDMVISTSIRQRSFAGGALMLSCEVARRDTPVIYGNTDDRNVKLWERVAGSEIVVGRYRCLYHHLKLAPWLVREGLPRWSSAVLGACFGALSALDRTILALRNHNDIKIRPLTEADSAFDTLWASVSKGFPNALVRDRAYIDWRFIQIPDRAYRLLGAFRGEALVGYLVLRRIEEGGLSTMRIVDIFGHRHDLAVFRTLIGAALDEARRIGADRLSMIEVHQPDLRRELALALFIPGRWTVNVTGRYLGNERELFFDAKRWWITFADGDLDLAA